MKSEVQFPSECAQAKYRQPRLSVTSNPQNLCGVVWCRTWRVNILLLELAVVRLDMECTPACWYMKPYLTNSNRHRQRAQLLVKRHQHARLHGCHQVVQHIMRFPKDDWNKGKTKYMINTRERQSTWETQGKDKVHEKHKGKTKYMRNTKKRQSTWETQRKDKVHDKHKEKTKYMINTRKRQSTW